MSGRLSIQMKQNSVILLNSSHSDPSVDSSEYKKVQMILDNDLRKCDFSTCDQNLEEFFCC